MAFYWTEQVALIKNGFDYDDFKKNIDIDISSHSYIYPYEHLKSLSIKDLNTLLRKRSLENQGTKEDKILRIQKYHISRLTPICQDEISHIFHVHTSERVTEYLKSIRLPITGDEEQLIRLLCGYESPNTGKLVCVNLLDKKIKESPKTLSLNTYVYRAIGDPSLIYIQNCIKRDNVRKRCKEREGVFLPALFTYNYSSTSLDISTAATFTQNNCCILKFKIPRSVDYLDTTKLTTTDGFEKIDELSEILLQRNIGYSNFKHIGYYNDTFKKKMIIVCEISPFIIGEIIYDDDIRFDTE